MRAAAGFLSAVVFAVLSAGSAFADPTIGATVIVRPGVIWFQDQDALGRWQKLKSAASVEDLAVFPEDVDIPAAAVSRLWRATCGLDPLAGERLLRTLMKWALLLAYNRAAGTVRLHDVMRKFLRDRVGDAGIAAQAKALVSAYPAGTGPRHSVAIRRLVMEGTWPLNRRPGRMWTWASRGARSR